jgi:surface protein
MGESLLEETGDNLLEEKNNPAESENTTRQKQLMEQLQKELEAAKKQREEMERRIRELEAGQRKTGEETERKAEELANSEPYAVLGNNNKTLTFYYDTKKTARKGLLLNSNQFPLANLNYTRSITTIIFDESFSDCHSIYSAVRWFEGMEKLTTIKGLNRLNTENITDMYSMFRGCSLLQELDLSNFNTGNVMNMEEMFKGCHFLKKLNLSTFDTTKVKSMARMFCDCSSLQELDLRSFNTINVTDMSGMFYGCLSLQKINLESFRTRNVTDMTGMFCGCSSLKKLDISSFEMENLGIMGKDCMFDGVDESIIKRQKSVIRMFRSLFGK